MEAQKFEKLMNAHGVAYITYTPEVILQGSRKTTFVVGTTEFDDPHIKRIEALNTETHGSPRPAVEPGEVLIFSYSKDKFRTLNLNSIKQVTSLSAEMNKATPCSQRK